MINHKFLETIKEYKMFDPGDKVVVAVSGGADSTALLNLLNAHREELGISLHVAHLNHMLRKGEAELDVKFVESLAQKLIIPVSVEAVDISAQAGEEKLGIEEMARKARYAFFERIAAKIGANKIAVGHTADDNVETFLMRLLRGSGLKGLCGIPPKRGTIVRPLIRIWRRQIEDYVGALKLVPRRDHTNYQAKYMRNSVRLKLIPQLKIYNLNIKEIILQTILLLTEDNLYLENKTAEALAGVILEEKDEMIRISTPKLNSLELPIQGHLLRQAIERVKGDLIQLSFQHIHDIMEKIDASEKWELHLPGGIFAMGDKTELVISRERARLREIKPFSYSLTIPGEVRIEEIGKTIRGAFATEFNKQNDPNIALIDYAALGKEIVVRNKLPGDRFTPLGVKGTKKLQDYFVDEKLPADERDLVPIVESGGKIVWVAGQRIDENAKVTDKTAKIVKLELL